MITDHHTGKQDRKEPETGLIGAENIKIQISQRRAKAKPKGVHCHKDTQHLCVGSGTEQIAGHQWDHDRFHGDGKDLQYGSDHRHNHTGRRIVQKRQQNKAENGGGLTEKQGRAQSFLIVGDTHQNFAEGQAQRGNGSGCGNKPGRQSDVCHMNHSNVADTLQADAGDEHHAAAR